MGDDDIYYCQKNENIVKVVSAFSTGMSKPTEVENQSHFNSEKTEKNENEGTFSCSFNRPISVQKNDIGTDKT